jgi:hypothetical protein
MFKKRCPYRRATGKEHDPLGKTKAHYANKKACLEADKEKIAPELNCVQENILVPELNCLQATSRKN